LGSENAILGNPGLRLDVDLPGILRGSAQADEKPTLCSRVPREGPIPTALGALQGRCQNVLSGHSPIFIRY